jgi:hypothetical protein
MTIMFGTSVTYVKLVTYVTSLTHVTCVTLWHKKVKKCTKLINMPIKKLNRCDTLWHDMTLWHLYENRKSSNLLDPLMTAKCTVGACTCSRPFPTFHLFSAWHNCYASIIIWWIPNALAWKLRQDELRHKWKCWRDYYAKSCWHDFWHNF